MPDLSKALNDAMNEQVEKELASAYLYLEMSIQVAENNLKGAAHWLRAQWEEELGHATKLIDYIADRGGRPSLGVLDKPRFEYTSLTDLFGQVLAHEQEVTQSIYALFAKAKDEHDYAAQTFLQWYITEQVEEENSARDVLDTLKVGGEEGPALLMVDRSLARRPAGGTEEAEE
jgi:ferritin